MSSGVAIPTMPLLAFLKYFTPASILKYTARSRCAGLNSGSSSMILTGTLSAAFTTPAMSAKYSASIAEKQETYVWH